MVKPPVAEYGLSASSVTVNSSPKSVVSNFSSVTLTPPIVTVVGSSS